MVAVKTTTIAIMIIVAVVFSHCWVIFFIFYPPLKSKVSFVATHYLLIF